ncbi:hypothetical protein FBZ94_101492 [Bradyrhizobium sacchari]|uniref:Uncharacterized protein n=1 Tax=Bradyrhizobium sacchari TaxID=1399419 RepID=A0A560KLN4_9BRAD|nr:hypothetical protein FBZ94_101492 [Bradyrhizobium sacchari]TWB84049.1 hypothetical protein FBZ95_101492 [Bradyrhizobium sacchari]
MIAQLLLVAGFAARVNAIKRQFLPLAAEVEG